MLRSKLARFYSVETFKNRTGTINTNPTNQFKFVANWGKYDIDIKSGNQENIQIDYDLTGEESIHINDDYQVTFKGKHHWFKRSNGNINIILPKHLSIADIDYVGRLKWQSCAVSNLNISMVGELSINNVQGDEIKLNCQAGKVDADNVTFKKVEIHSNAGQVVATNLIADNLITSNHAGSIEIIGTVAENAELTSKVGLIKADITSRNGKIVADSNVGNIEANLKDYSLADLKSSVGHINANLYPANESQTLMKASLASIKADMNGFKGKCQTGPHAKLTVNGRKASVSDIPNGNSSLSAETGFGDIKIDFH